VGGLSYESAWIPELTREWRRHVVQATIAIDRLRGDSEFKQNILREIEAEGEKLNLKELVRDYISGLGSVHAKLRALLAPRVNAWDERLLGTLRNYQATIDADLAIVVEVLATNDQGETIEEVQVFTGPIDRRKSLEQKNRNVGYLTKILITSE
jgi:hypothetical protein